MWWVAAAWAAKPVVVTMTVTNPAGQPIPTAIVVWDDELERHRVNTFTGGWEGSTLYLPDGTQRPFAVDAPARAWVSAPGYAAARVDVVVDKRKVAVPVTLQPLEVPTFACADGPLTADGGAAAATQARAALGNAEGLDARACLWGVIVWGRALDWADAEADFLVTMDDDAANKRRYDARKAALDAIRGAREWRAGAGLDLTPLHAVCVSVAGTPSDCR